MVEQGRREGLSGSIGPRAIITAFNPVPLPSLWIQSAATIDKYVSNNSSRLAHAFLRYLCESLDGEAQSMEEKGTCIYYVYIYIHRRMRRYLKLGENRRTRWTKREMEGRRESLIWRRNESTGLPGDDLCFLRFRNPVQFLIKDRSGSRGLNWFSCSFFLPLIPAPLSPSAFRRAVSLSWKAPSAFGARVARNPAALLEKGRNEKGCDLPSTLSSCRGVHGVPQQARR